jgi:probable H4MPT-linked C1 transfer pathway protein
MPVLALDVGGANLKAADGLGSAATQSFELWRRPQDLAEALAALIADAPPCDQLAVTMTGELCDCFATKAEGVRHILECVRQAADSRPIAVYLVDGRFVSVEAAGERPDLAAASNWHALASFAALKFAPQEPAVLVDCGSTTTDVIPLDGGRPVARGASDPQRLETGELVYTGVERTPLCAVVRQLPYRGRPCRVAAEFFATTGDAYRWLGLIEEEPETCETADGRPRTKACSQGRLARAICSDISDFTPADATAASRAVLEAQTLQIEESLRQVIEAMTRPPESIILSGQGEFLARRAVARLDPFGRLVSLSEQLDSQVSRCAPAHALAVLFRQQRTEPQAP